MQLTNSRWSVNLPRQSPDTGHLDNAARPHKRSR